MEDVETVETSGLISEVAELSTRERALTYLLGRSCPGNHLEAQQELAATRVLLQAAEENLRALLHNRSLD